MRRIEKQAVGKLGKQGGELVWLECFHEIAVALAFCGGRMTTTTDSVVDTTSRLAQWRIHHHFPISYRKSDPFRIGNWNWHLVVEKNKKLVLIKLFPKLPPLHHDYTPPVASFNIRIISFLEGGRNTLVHPEVRDKQLKRGEDFVWVLDQEEVPLTAGRFIIDVEFIDLKTTAGGEERSIWSEGFPHTTTPLTTSLGRMLSESIHPDIIIRASNGSIGAHRAVLAARSPVFQSMFSHDLKEKEMSAINISDMSIQVCQAFLSYIYSNIQYQDFLTHRLDLLIAADKYDVSDLRDACQESLLQDIYANNVLHRLHNASLYRLPRLKLCCLQYLVKFGKIFDIVDEFNAFIQFADRELIAEVVNEILSVWKGF